MVSSDDDETKGINISGGSVEIGRDMINGDATYIYQLNLPKSEQGRAISHSPVESAIDALQNERGNRRHLLKRALESLTQVLTEIEPKMKSKVDIDDDLVGALAETIPAITDAGKLFDVVAESEIEPHIHTLHAWFLGLLSEQFADGINQDHIAYNYWLFLGNEIFMMLIGALLDVQRLEALPALLNYRYIVRNIRGDLGGLSYAYFSGYPPLLQDRNTRLRLHRQTLQADMLKERHSTGELGSVSPWDRIMDADAFLVTRNHYVGEKEIVRTHWYMTCGEYVRFYSAWFLQQAYNKRNADKLVEALNAPDLNSLKEWLHAELQSTDSHFESKVPFARGIQVNLLGST